MRKLIHKLLGIDGYYDFVKKTLVAEARMRDLEIRIDALQDSSHDLKYEQESLEYNLGELEMRVDEIESIDIENLKDDLKYEVNNLKDEVNEVLTNFESMTEGYTVSVKLNPPL
jgi:chromosome segregation ATPase